MVVYFYIVLIFKFCKIQYGEYIVNLKEMNCYRNFIYILMLYILYSVLGNLGEFINLLK